MTNDFNKINFLTFKLHWKEKPHNSFQFISFPFEHFIHSSFQEYSQYVFEMILPAINKNDNNTRWKKYEEIESFQQENLAFVASKIFNFDELSLLWGIVDVVC